VPFLETADFGRIEYAAGEVVRFPAGLPAFEDAREFLVLHLPGAEPFVVLHGVDRPGLRFFCLPWSRFVPGAAAELGEEERAVLELGGDEAAADLVALAMVAAPPQGPATVNLLAPVVIHFGLEKRRGVQAIQSGRGLPARHPLEAGTGGAPACS
jgi:flagellar assembly factor FliW